MAKKEINKIPNSKTKMKPIAKITTTTGQQYKIVPQAKYLGISVSLGMKKEGVTMVQSLKKKLTSLTAISWKTRTKMTLRAEQVYVESIFRFLVTPHVLTYTIKPQEALELWAKVHRQFMKAPPGVTKNFMQSATRQRSWVKWFNSQLELLNTKTPLDRAHKVKQQLAAALAVTDNDLHIQRSVTKLAEERTDIRTVQFEWRGAVGATHSWCLKCTRPYKLPTPDMVQHKNTIFTDGSAVTTRKGLKFAGAGVYSEGLNAQMALLLKAKTSKPLTNNTAELVAILKATEIARNSNLQEVVIATDS